MDIDLPAPYRLRPYRGRSDHPMMVEILTAFRGHVGDPERPTVEQFDVVYEHLSNCDPATDIAIVERVATDGSVDPVGYVRNEWDDLSHGGRDCVVFAPLVPDHVGRELFVALVRGQEAHMHAWTVGVPGARYRAYSAHPGPGRPASGEAAWLEDLGYTAMRFGASLVRPHLDDIPHRALPDGVEVRPVAEHQLRSIFDAHWEAFSDEWDARPSTEDDFLEFLDDPLRDESLWKVAWVGDAVVGQVKSYVNREENETMGYLRGYTENISTHADWRNRGIAGALLAMSLRELRDRGMTEAALGVDTANPGGAFHLYTGLGFDLRSYEAVYVKPAG